MKPYSERLEEAKARVIPILKELGIDISPSLSWIDTTVIPVADPAPAAEEKVDTLPASDTTDAK